MDLVQRFLEQYGYVAVFLGCLAEGETVLVLAGFAAHLGYLALPTVIGVAALAGFAGDQVLFEIGRRGGAAFFERFPSLKPARPHAQRFVDRFGAWAAFGIRFMVGMRIAGVIAIGSTHFPRGRFMLANAFGAVAWATLGALAGFVFGQAFTLFLERAKHLELAAFAVVAAIAFAAVLLMRKRRRRRWLAGG